jgi:hypothetical protein
MNISSAMPPQRIAWLEKVRCTVDFTEYFARRAPFARPHSVSADQMCSATAAMSERRNSHRKPVYGRIGSSIVRRWCAYSSYECTPPKIGRILRFPHMWNSTKKTKYRPEIAITILSAMDEWVGLGRVGVRVEVATCAVCPVLVGD